MSAPNKSYDPVEVAALAPEALDRHKEEALAAIGAASTLEELKEVRLAHAGDRSPLALANREIGALPPHAKADAGKRVGAARGAVTQARQRLGAEVVGEVFERVARPAATQATAGAWPGRWRLMAIDGFTLDVPDTTANLAEFPNASAGGYETVYPQARVVAISECASHAIVAADTSGRWDSEQTLAYSLYGRLTPEMLLTADRGFSSFHAWRYASSTGAQLLWRIQDGLHPYWLKDLDGASWLAVITKPTKLRQSQKERLRQDARRGRDLDPDQAVIVRVVDYTVPDRKGEHIRLITTILDPAEATAQQLAACYHERWEAETGFAQLKTHLRGPGRILRSRTPDLVRQEIWAYLLTHWALATLICTAATAAGVDPDRIKFLATLRIVRHSVTDQAAFPP